MKRLLDKTDERLLLELADNARLSHAELAERVHLSRNAVRQRVERLERDGHIRGYTIVRGSAGGEQPLVSALIFVYRHDRLRGVDVTQALAKIPEVVSCDVVAGEFDIVLRVESPDADRIRAVWESISALPGVRDTVTAFVLSNLVRR